MKKCYFLRKIIGVSVVVCILLACVGQAVAQTISTIAGRYSIGGTYSGDGGQATAAGIYSLQAARVDASGNLYIVDYNWGVIRKVDISTGTISIYAGNHSQNGNFVGDGAAATAAGMSNPTYICFDGSGNMLIADQNNSCVRKVNHSTGIITTVAGQGGNFGYSGDGGAATAALMGSPIGVAVDGSGNIYVSDDSYNTIRKINTSGIISTVAGTPSVGGYTGDGGQATASELSAPFGIFVDGSGNIYFADFSNNVVRKVTTSGIISTVAGNYALGSGYSGDGGQATAAQLNQPNGMYVDGSGNMYIADWTNAVVRKVNSGGIISTVVGKNDTVGYHGDGSPATAAWGFACSDITFDGSGNMIIADQSDFVVRKVIMGCSVASITGITTLPPTATTTLADATSSGVWTSGSTGVATIGTGTGIVAGVAAGSTVISYTVGGCGVATTTVNVNASPLVWYSATGGGDASNLSKWWSNNNNTGYQPTVFSTTNSTWIFQSNMTSTATLSFTGNVSLVSGGTFTPLSGSTTTVGGNWKNPSGSFVRNGGTVVFGGANTTNSVDTLSGSMTGTNAFNNITFNGSGISYTFQGNSADVDGVFAQSAGTVTAPSTTLTVSGNFNHTAGTFTPNGGTVLMNGSSCSITATGMTTTTTNCFNNLSFSAGSACTYTISSPLLLMGNFNNSTSFGTIAVGNNDITIGGNWNCAGPLTAGLCHFMLNGAGVRTLAGKM